MKILPPAANVLLADAIARDRTTARRAALVNFLLQERYLTRERLIARVEGLLGKGCFGDSARVDTFFRDMRVVKQALKAAGFQPAYSRSLKQPGYYLQGQPPVGHSVNCHSGRQCCRSRCITNCHPQTINPHPALPAGLFDQQSCPPGGCKSDPPKKSPNQPCRISAPGNPERQHPNDRSHHPL